jgi:flagellar basal body-associated protein FliL
MTQIAPYYFDNELVSANVQKSTRGEGEVEFVFEVNVNDDELKEEVSTRLGEFDDEVTRWHVDTEKQTETVEAAEGVEPPESPGQSRSTTN